MADVEDSQIVPVESQATLALIEIPVGSHFSSAPLTENDFRVPLQLESCLAIRANQANGESRQLTYIHYPIELDEIGEGWKLKSFSGDRNVWHGAPVLSERDGRLIGVLIVQPGSTRVEMLPERIAK